MLLGQMKIGDDIVNIVIMVYSTEGINRNLYQPKRRTRKDYYNECTL